MLLANIGMTALCQLTAPTTWLCLLSVCHFTLLENLTRCFVAVGSAGNSLEASKSSNKFLIICLPLIVCIIISYRRS